ncbi:MAG: PadR family transcriptional regulator [Turicibacter sp.]|nr:PadR family transcriptional regulator [Turicibacter sp.]
MSLKHGLLGFLTYGDMSGYDLEKLFSQSIGHFWSAKISQVYRDLTTMEKTGWVASEMVVQTGKPNKKVFKITEGGQQELERWLLEYDVSQALEIRVGLLMRMFFSKRVPVQATIQMLGRFQHICQKALEGLQQAEREVPKENPDYFYIKTTLSYGRKYYQMQIEWCEETLHLLGGDGQEAHHIGQ